MADHTYIGDQEARVFIRLMFLLVHEVEVEDREEEMTATQCDLIRHSQRTSYV